MICVCVQMRSSMVHWCLQLAKSHSHSRLLFVQLFLVDNLIKLFIVDIYHVIKHATLSVYNNVQKALLRIPLSFHFYFFIACFFFIHNIMQLFICLLYVKY